jgi:hypothetical protein
MNMRTKILIAALAALLLAGPVRAEDAKPASSTDSIMTFFKHMKEALAQSAVKNERKKGTHLNGNVAAVRGKDQSSALGDPNETLIKGDSRSKKEKAGMAEDAEMSKGVDLILAGKIDEGVKSLEDFKAAHPKSRNLEKAQGMIDQAKALSAAKPAESPAPAAAAPEAPKDAAPAVPDAKP